MVTNESMERRRRLGNEVSEQRSKSSGKKSGVIVQRRAWPYMMFLTLQYGVQPIISKRYSGKEVILTTTVLACEALKVIFGLLFMLWEGSLWSVQKDWHLWDALTASALPAGIYALQNTMLQISYRNLDSLTFSLLNQTKLLFTAMFMFLILGIKQSKQQTQALILLLLAAMLLSIGQSSSKGSAKVDPEAAAAFTMGVLPVLFASVLSGLASTLCQWASQVKRRSTYLMTVEMSVIGSLCLLVSMVKSPDGEAVLKRGFFSGWTPLTFLPIVTNAVGGILVGLVTTYAGGVRKGFVIVSALVVTALLQFVVDGIPPSFYVLLSMPLVIISNVMYQRHASSKNKKQT